MPSEMEGRGTENQEGQAQERSVQVGQVPQTVEEYGSLCPFCHTSSMTTRDPWRGKGRSRGSGAYPLNICGSCGTRWVPGRSFMITQGRGQMVTLIFGEDTVYLLDELMETELQAIPWELSFGPYDPRLAKVDLEARDFRYRGTVSSATMRPEDLIPKFLDVLEDLDPSRWMELRDNFEDLITLAESEDGGWEHAVDEYRDNPDLSEEPDWLVEALFESLDSCAPEFYYFGSSEGDASDYGFWLSREAILG